MPVESHQWKCFAVRSISRYRERASDCVTDWVRCLAVRAVVMGVIIVGGMVNEWGGG